VGIFNGMNNTFMHMQFEFENPPSVRHSMASQPAFHGTMPDFLDGACGVVGRSLNLCASLHRLGYAIFHCGAHLIKLLFVLFRQR
jgi:hypothetical protein